MHADTAAWRRVAHLDALDERQRMVAGRSGLDLLTYLYEAGLSWTDVARLVGVSVPAVQKWRRGDGITAENRRKLSRLVALLEWLNDELISEPASWLEMPVKTGVAVSRMDMLLANRYDLVVQMIPDEYEQTVGVEEVLDAFEPEWRSSRVDERFETFMGEDGFMSIRPRAE